MLPSAQGSASDVPKKKQHVTAHRSDSTVGLLLPTTLAPAEEDTVSSSQLLLLFNTGQPVG